MLKQTPFKATSVDPVALRNRLAALQEELLSKIGKLPSLGEDASSSEMQRYEGEERAAAAAELAKGQDGKSANTPKSTSSAAEDAAAEEAAEEAAARVVQVQDQQPSQQLLFRDDQTQLCNHLIRLGGAVAVLGVAGALVQRLCKK